MHFGMPTPGTTGHNLSCEPLATEGEATPGPDDQNPYDEHTDRIEQRGFTLKEDPTEDPDPFVFDDVEEVVMDFEFPAFDAPRF